MPTYRGEVAERWTYGTVGGDRCHLVGQPAVLRRLHAGATVRRGQAVHMPVQRRRHGPAGPMRSGASDGEIRALVEGVWSARADRYSELRSQPRATSRASRCSPSAAEAEAARSARAWSPTRSGEASYPPGINSVENSWKRHSAGARNSWISGLPRSWPRLHLVLPEGAVRGRGDPRSHQGNPSSGPVASGACYPVATASASSPGGARRDVTGIPVSVLPSGGRSLRAPAVYPWTSSRRPA